MVIVVAIGLVLAFTAWSHLSLGKAAHQLSDTMSAVEHRVRAGRWDLAQTILGKAEKRWHRVRPICSLVVNDAQLREIDMALSKLTVEIQGQRQKDALITISQLALRFSYIGDGEQISLPNLL